MGKELIFSMSFGMCLLYVVLQGFTSGNELPSQKEHSFLAASPFSHATDLREFFEDGRMHRLY